MRRPLGAYYRVDIRKGGADIQAEIQIWVKKNSYGPDDRPITRIPFDKATQPIEAHTQSLPDGAYTHPLNIEAASGKGLRFGKELLPPPVTLLNTRDARGIYATVNIAREVTTDFCNGRFFHFGLHSNQLPLGWSLSTKAENILQQELAGAAATMAELSKALNSPEPVDGCQANHL